MISEEKYYEYMNSFENMPKEDVHEKWFQCFAWILKSYKVGYRDSTIRSLFYDFDMCNWEAMHKDNSVFKDYSKDRIFEEFCGECRYVCDRCSYDRLFRTHWLFRQVFGEYGLIEKPEPKRT